MSVTDLQQAEILVFGCGNSLFGDDGLAPKVVAHLAQEQEKSHSPLPPRVAYIDAGTSIRTLLADVLLYQDLCQPQGRKLKKIIVVDTVQQGHVPPGTVNIAEVTFSKEEEARILCSHNAPTWELLYQIHRALGIDVDVITIEAQYFPECMDDTLSTAAINAFAHVQNTIQERCAQNI